MSMFQKVFGTHSEREVKRIKPLVDKIEALRPTMQALSDEDLRNKTTEFKERLSNGVPAPVGPTMAAFVPAGMWRDTS